MTTKQWTALGTIVGVIGIVVPIILSLSSTTPTSIEVKNSNVAIGNTGPVTQNLENSHSKNVAQVEVTGPSNKESDGVYHTKIVITLGVVPGAQKPEITTFNTPTGISCGSLSYMGPAIILSESLVGLALYQWTAECLSKDPISDFNYKLSYQ